MDLIIGILLLGGLTSTYGFHQSEDSDCPPDWMHAPTKDCFKFLPSKTNMSWLDAQYECERAGGYLAEPKTLDQMEFLEEISSFYGLNLWWIGLSDLGHEGIWSWQHSMEIVSNGFWDSGCPSNQSDNRLDCAYLSGDQLAWKDGDCRNSLVGHDLIAPICQKETYFPHNNTTTYSPQNTTRTTYYPHTNTTTDFPHHNTTTPRTTPFLHNTTITYSPQNTTRTTYYPHINTTTDFPHHNTTTARTTPFPHNTTITYSPQNTTRTTYYPQTNTTTDFPHHNTTTPRTTPFPHNTTITYSPQNTTRTTYFPHTNTTTDFPHHNTTTPRTTPFPHNTTITYSPQNTTRTTYYPHTKTTTHRTTNTTTASYPETTTADGCPFAWSEFDGSCFYLLPESMTWLEARETCHSIGADLASIHSEEQNNFISDLVDEFVGPHKEGHYWLGGTDSHSEGSWEWSNGSPWDYQNWDDKNENGGVVYNCLSYYNHCPSNNVYNCDVSDDDNYWDQDWTDLECSFSLLSICQIN